MKKLFLLSAILIACGAVIAPLYLASVIPDKVQETLLRGLLEVGFDKVMAGTVEQESGTVTLKNITIGDGGFSSIREVRAEYSWIGILFKRRIDNLHINGMKLTGEINDDNSLTLAGWNKPEELHKTSLTYTDTITIENAQIDLLSSVGGINLKLNGQVRRKAAYGLAFQGNVEGAQRQLSIGAKITGEIAASGNWQSNIEIEEGKMDFGPVRAGRMSGQSQIYGRGTNILNTTTQLSAGAMTIYGLPWQNAGVTVEGEPGSFKVFLEGKSIGEEGIELGINFDFTDAIENLEGTIHTQSISELFKFLQQHQLVPGDLNAPVLLQAIPDLSFSFYQTPALENSKKSFAYTVRDNRQILDLKGEIEVNSKEKILNGTLSVSPVLLERFTAQPEQTPQDGFRGGVISVSGDFRIGLEEKSISTEGKIAAKLEDARYAIAPLHFEKINGDIIFDDLKSWSLSRPASLTFGLPLKETINHKGKAGLKITPDNRVTLNEPLLEIFGGTIKSSAIELSKKPEDRDVNLTLNSLDMGQAALALDINRLHITGLLSGTLPMKYRDGKLHIEGGALKSTEGTIRYRPETPPPFLSNDDVYTETMRMALENYRFDDLSLRIDGPVDGDLTLAISAKGANPELFEGRPIALNFSLVIKLSGLLKKLARQG